MDISKIKNDTNYILEKKVEIEIESAKKVAEKKTRNERIPITQRLLNNLICEELRKRLNSNEIAPYYKTELDSGFILLDANFTVRCHYHPIYEQKGFKICLPHFLTYKYSTDRINIEDMEKGVKVYKTLIDICNENFEEFRGSCTCESIWGKRYKTKEELF